jgi:hypothetical protein
LFSEALASLLLAKTLLKTLSFHRLAQLMERPASRRSVSAQNTETYRNVRWAVQTAAGFIPGNTACFPRGIAAHFMCRRRGIETTLVYGARICEDGRLKAHVWTRDGAQGIIGHAVSEEFRVLAQFPGRGL